MPGPTALTKNTAMGRYWFDPSRLNAALRGSFRQSVTAAAKVAEARNPWPNRIVVRGMLATNTQDRAFIIGRGPLGHLPETGAQPHVIAPGAVASSRSSTRRIDGVRTRVSSVRTRRGGKKAMAGPGLAHPISVPVNHPGMAKRPYLTPARDWWVRGGYQSVSRSSLARQGFRAGPR